MRIFKTLLLIGINLIFNLSCVLYAQEGEYFSIEELIGKTTPKNSNNPYKLRGEVYEAFSKMEQAALKDGIKIKMVSAYRSYSHQQRIWNRKFKRFKSYGMTDSLAVEKILEYSTIPGTSRHHWGTDIDIVMHTETRVNKLLLPSNFGENGPFYKLKKWMEQNADHYGFKLIYTNDPDRKGFYYEPWHYTYFATAKKMLTAYQEQNCINHINLKGNLGHHIINKERIDRYLKDNIVTVLQ